MEVIEELPHPTLNYKVAKLNTTDDGLLTVKNSKLCPSQLENFYFENLHISFLIKVIYPIEL